MYFRCPFTSSVSRYHMSGELAVTHVTENVGLRTSPVPEAVVGHSSVVDRCTDLFVDSFGDEGPARSASRGFAVEIEAVASARLPHTPQPS